MAEKKSSSRAEQAVSNAKKSNTKSGSKSSAKKTDAGSGKKNVSASEKKMIEAHDKKQPVLPSRVSAALVTLVFFVLFLVVGIRPEGVLLLALRDLMLSLIGMAAFYFAIPGLLYIFYILLLLYLHFFQYNNND